jgi:hypothetical protein
MEMYIDPGIPIVAPQASHRKSQNIPITTEKKQTIFTDSAFNGLLYLVRPKPAEKGDHEPCISSFLPP